MGRFYFDIRDEDRTIPDEEGMILPDMEAVRREAALSLAEIARDAIRTGLGASTRLELAIEARTDEGPILEARLAFEFTRIR